jgi:dTMP kinase
VTAELYFQPGSLVVFEGLDRSGKSTQLKRLSRLNWAAQGPLFVHMPSGLTALTKRIYALTENENIRSPLGRQLLHLACHAENIASIAEARIQHGLILDRWWWSTVAYGWYAGHLAASGVSESAFLGMIKSIWSGQAADLLFLFMKPFENDELNREEVRSGYMALAKEHPSTTVVVPPGDPEATTGFVLGNLRDRELLS